MIDFNAIKEAVHELEPIITLVETILEMPEDSFDTPQKVEIVCNALRGAYSGQLKEEAIEELVRVMREDGANRDEVEEQFSQLKMVFPDLVPEDVSEGKKQVLDTFFMLLIDILDTATAQLGTYDTTVYFELIHPNAKVPTYANPTDAGADIYAVEDINIPAGATGFKVNVGFKMAMNEGWKALIYPRSGMSMKTGMRISNSVGVIDAAYRGEVAVLFDNISNEDYTIKVGDRIAQMIISPAYTFKANIVENVERIGDNRGGGFGHSGN